MEDSRRGWGGNHLLLILENLSGGNLEEKRDSLDSFGCFKRTEGEPVSEQWKKHLTGNQRPWPLHPQLYH